MHRARRSRECHRHCLPRSRVRAPRSTEIAPPSIRPPCGCPIDLVIVSYHAPACKIIGDSVIILVLVVDIVVVAARDRWLIVRTLFVEESAALVEPDHRETTTRWRASHHHHPYLLSHRSIQWASHPSRQVACLLASWLIRYARSASSISLSAKNTADAGLLRFKAALTLLLRLASTDFELARVSDTSIYRERERSIARSLAACGAWMGAE